jgi:hypothetical protein
LQTAWDTPAATPHALYYTTHTTPTARLPTARLAQNLPPTSSDLFRNAPQHRRLTCQFPGFHADAWATSPKAKQAHPPPHCVCSHPPGPPPTEECHPRRCRHCTPGPRWQRRRRDSLSRRSPRVPCNPLHYGQPLLHPSSSSLVSPLTCRRHSKPSALQPVTLPTHRGCRACVSRLCHFKLDMACTTL